MAERFFLVKSTGLVATAKTVGHAFDLKWRSRNNMYWWTYFCYEMEEYDVALLRFNFLFDGSDQNPLYTLEVAGYPANQIILEVKMIYDRPDLSEHMMRLAGSRPDLLVPAPAQLVRSDLTERKGIPMPYDPSDDYDESEG